MIWYWYYILSSAVWRLIFNIFQTIPYDPSLQVTFTCDVDYTCMVNSIRWYHTTPDNTTTTQLKVGHVSVFYSFQIRERPSLERGEESSKFLI